MGFSEIIKFQTKSVYATYIAEHSVIKINKENNFKDNTALVKCKTIQNSRHFNKFIAHGSDS